MAIDVESMEEKREKQRQKTGRELLNCPKHPRVMRRNTFVLNKMFNNLYRMTYETTCVK